jgi:hypothetical protein
VGDVDIMEQVWRCAIPPFSEKEEKELVWGSTTIEAVDAVIEARMEDVRARMYETRADNNPMAFRMRIAWRDHVIGRIEGSELPT